MMSNNLFIDEKLIEDAIKATGLKTKQEVIELALKTLIKLKQQEKIKAYRGKLKWEGNLEEMRTNL
jgi:Arc/MetJ family transcription regulator